MPDIDLGLAAVGLVVGLTVGLTGMGGGALMTPLLVLLFKVEPLAAVSSDLVASFVMKPVGGGVHLRRGTVNLRLVGWLCAGSIPSAFAGVLVLRGLGDEAEIQDILEVLLGAALLVASTTIVLKALLQGRQGEGTDGPLPVNHIAVRPLPTVAIGALGGLVVGMTSVGSGSLMIVLLLVLYPRLTTGRLVGTDLVQAVPLVGAASLGHLLFGDFRLAVAGSLLIGAVPGVYVGAQLSSRAADHLVRPVLVVVLAASGLRLLGVPLEVVGALLVVTAVVAIRVVLRRRRQAARTGPAGDGTPSDRQLVGP
ncbi:MAG TPA: sulfite exporter TauE/SafE family protein [Acidimicrobiales bacterium]|nr:sulfite exporter TauE/SafE family protein [Acidimicrobiales bacterium]